MSQLYHRTPSYNVQPIMEKGLLPTPNFVCLSTNADSWYNEYSLLAIDIDTFMHDFPDILVKTWLPELDEVCVWGKIPAKYITIVS